MDVVPVVNNADEAKADGRAGAVVVVTNLTDGVKFGFVLL